MNRALRVGRVDPLVVALLGRLASTHLSPHFRVIGTHALYAYETAAGVRLDPDTLATRDIDLLWDTRKRILFSTPLARVDSSMLGVLKKVDSSFRIRKSQKYTAVNKDGFEVGIIRRERTDDDPHPIQTQRRRRRLLGRPGPPRQPAAGLPRLFRRHRRQQRHHGPHEHRAPGGPLSPSNAGWPTRPNAKPSSGGGMCCRRMRCRRCWRGICRRFDAELACSPFRYCSGSYEKHSE